MRARSYAPNWTAPSTERMIRAWRRSGADLDGAAGGAVLALHGGALHGQREPAAAGLAQLLRGLRVEPDLHDAGRTGREGERRPRRLALLRGRGRRLGGLAP